MRTRFVIIHSDSGIKVNILGGKGISHCEKIFPHEYVSNSEFLLR